MGLSNPTTAEDLQVRIGDIAIAIEGDISRGKDVSALPYDPFFCDGTPNIRLRLHRGRIEQGRCEKVFACPPIWSLYRQNSSSFFEIFADMPERTRTLVIRPSQDSADLHFHAATDRFADPFFGPTLELLMVHTLARGKGVILHGCGIALGERGILFVGESGAGKSTLAKLWSRRQGVQVLSDDRIIVRKAAGGFRMYGTPWHGTGRFGLPFGVPVERILFLRHGSRNTVTAVGPMASVAKLLSCSFPPYWNGDGMAFTLELLQGLAEVLPCGDFAFRPDKSAVEYLAGK